jgi:hypothetical protein
MDALLGCALRLDEFRVDWHGLQRLPQRFSLLPRSRIWQRGIAPADRQATSAQVFKSKPLPVTK